YTKKNIIQITTIPTKIFEPPPPPLFPLSSFFLPNHFFFSFLTFLSLLPFVFPSSSLSYLSLTEILSSLISLSHPYFSLLKRSTTLYFFYPILSIFFNFFFLSFLLTLLSFAYLL